MRSKLFLSYQSLLQGHPIFDLQRAFSFDL